MTDEIAAARQLRRLLSEPGSYRRQWVRYVRRNSRSDLNQSAVAQVLAEHLWDTGEVDERDAELPRRLKDPVSRALSGRRLSVRMLQLFIEAFDIAGTDAAQLFALRDGVGEDVAVVRRDAPPPPAAPSRGYETIMLHEFHTIGADHRPIEHRTIQGIRATEQLARYRYMFDTATAAVEIVRGGRVSPPYRTELDGIYAVDIHLAEACSRARQPRSSTGRSSPIGSRPNRCSGGWRGAGSPTSRSTFQPRFLPTEVSWCVWDADDYTQLISSTPVRLDAEASVHHFLHVLEGRGVGFAWKWLDHSPAP